MVVAVALTVAVGLTWAGREPVFARSAERPTPIAQAGNPTLVLETSKGDIEIELLKDEAPQTVEYVINLVKKNFYRGLRFHRAEKGLVQVGDPTSRDVTRKAWWGRTGTTPTVGVAEISKKLIHVRGMVGLAHVGDPKFASSQFYIMKESSPSLNRKYALFGRVRKGMPVVDTIEVADVLKLATIREAE